MVSYWCSERSYASSTNIYFTIFKQGTDLILNYYSDSLVNRVFTAITMVFFEEFLSVISL